MSEIHLTRAVYQDTKESVSIEEVKSGLQENIVCACCGAKLIANKGQKKAWYFSHYFDEACLLAYETQLHLTAKEYFEKIGKIPMPLEAGWVESNQCVELAVSNAQVEVYMDGRRPDLIVDVGTEQYWVEIANKHKCDADKIWSCRASDRNVIEVDVSRCGHLDKFDSLDNCLVRIQSLNPCNDYLDEIAHNTTRKHEKVRKQFEALTRSQCELGKKKEAQEEAEKTLEERIETQQNKYESRLERMKQRESAQDAILAELEKSTKTHKRALQDIEERKANIENEINERLKIRFLEFEQSNQQKLYELQHELESQWQQELVTRREQLDQKLKEEFEQCFQEELVAMEARRQKHKKLKEAISAQELEVSFLQSELDSLILSKQSLKEEQARQIENELYGLIDKRKNLNDEVGQLELTIKEKLLEVDLIDTYENHLDEVKQFCLARSDYHNEINRRMREMEGIEGRVCELNAEYAMKKNDLDVMVKLSNEFVKAFRVTFDMLERDKLIKHIPNKLAERILKNTLLLSRNAQEELDDVNRNRIER